jgi:transcriptional regulator with XRE-family HTH domain
MHMTTLAGRIRKARLHACVSQRQLANKLKVTRGAVANWECAGGIAPSTERLLRIAEATGTSLEWLATGRGACKYEPMPDDVACLADMQIVSDHLELRLLHALRSVPRRQQGRIIKAIEAHAMSALNPA